MPTTGRRGDFGPKADFPTPQLTLRELELYRQMEGAPCRSNRVNSLVAGLTGIIMIGLGTVNRQWQGHYNLISLMSIL